MSYQHQILGTIVASALNYDQFCRTIGEGAAVDNSHSSYAPCDGRPILNSTLERSSRVSATQPDPHFHIANATDLRGKFLRGLNVMYSAGEPIPFDPNTNGDPQPNRTVCDYQTDDVKPHTHPASSSGGFAHNQSGMGIQANEGPEIQFSTPGITVGTNLGSESRPRNISVYFYIKIN